jgi:hypothetical protein
MAKPQPHDTQELILQLEKCIKDQRDRAGPRHQAPRLLHMAELDSEDDLELKEDGTIVNAEGDIVGHVDAEVLE